MRKLLLISLLFVGLSSFASENVVEKQSNSSSSMVIFEQNSIIENIFDNSDGFYRCRADIYYEGRYIASTYGYGSTASEACNNAQNAGLEFIKHQD